MMVKIGSARHDENGSYTNGRAGDQDGTEVSTQNFYMHSKGWIVIRPKNSDEAEKIAFCMQAACDNPLIGYDQNQRDTLYSEAKSYGFDVRKIQKAVETDCSALVRVCCRYAGISVGDFYTGNAADVLKATGYFDILTFKSEAELKRGDILCTNTKGHIVVCLTNGTATPKYKAETWYSDPNGWWYAKTETDYAKNEFLIINHHKYYFDEKGYSVIGCQVIEDRRYCFETSGNLMGAMMCTDQNGILSVKEF